MATRVTGRVLRVMTALCALTAGLVSAGDAHAFSVKKTAHGLPVHWAKTTVPFIVGRSIESAVEGGVTSVSNAARAWSGAAGAPSLTAAEGDCPSVPTVDGKNCIIFAPHGFLPAGNALAITLVTFDPATGEIVDTDIVVNGTHRFAALATGTTPPAGTTPVSTEGGSAAPSTAGSSGSTTHTDDEKSSTVVCSISSTSLRTKSDTRSVSPIPPTAPRRSCTRTRCRTTRRCGLPPATTSRGLTSTLYTSTGQSAAKGGCGATVAGAPVGAQDAWAGLAFLAMAGLGVESRRRAGRAGGLKCDASRP